MWFLYRQTVVFVAPIRIYSLETRYVTFISTDFFFYVVCTNQSTDPEDTLYDLGIAGLRYLFAT